ncbi:RagB/SusD family nutrient uptake outer membrane protein [Mangrovibacterium lignilyticum]|uniref:RagB/SusD family nutrient uptake outer membrane protein n=1 Tax=Mangrovibacterium lignilyticum TaxID=2668052 RepID=UPI0013D8DBB7|nr:RagB/SusD family nutrient uptake outer membrane protein [Mangrovibacterium lignilyticum]
MKKRLRNILLGLLVVATVACDSEFSNPNEPNEENAYSSLAGFYAVCVGLRTHYSVSSLRYAVYVPGITTREIGTTSTYQTPMDLAYGGTSLTNINTGVGSLWSALLKDKGQAEDIIGKIDNITMAEETRNGILAFANYFKALTLCNLYQNFEQFPLMNSADGDAEFATASEGLAKMVSLLLEAQDLVQAGVSSDFASNVLGNIELDNCIEALLSRVYLYQGDYTSCIAVAGGIDLTSMSTFAYDNENYNPVYAFAVDGSPYLLPKDNFGLTGDYLPADGDGRYDFYLAAPDTVELEELGGAALKQINGFFSTYSSEIPVYLPGEILLNIAEAYARSSDLSNAVTYVNAVVTKTDDAYGLNASLADQTAYLSSLSQSELLEEIYKQRCIELFFTGQRLVDSRRFHPDLDFNHSSDLTSERNRDYYPYPQEERDNNPNCPDDPEI